MKDSSESPQDSQVRRAEQAERGAACVKQPGIRRVTDHVSVKGTLAYVIKQPCSTPTRRPVMHRANIQGAIIPKPTFRSVLIFKILIDCSSHESVVSVTLKGEAVTKYFIWHSHRLFAVNGFLPQLCSPAVSSHMSLLSEYTQDFPEYRSSYESLATENICPSSIMPGSVLLQKHKEEKGVHSYLEAQNVMRCLSPFWLR